MRLGEVRAGGTRGVRCLLVGDGDGLVVPYLGMGE